MENSTEAEKFLKVYHAKHPGCTSQAMSSGLTSANGSSYELLTSMIPTGSSVDITVLDLACGDGYLLQELHKRNQLGLHLVGVDMSEDELSAARRRLSDRRVSLLTARAQVIPLPDESVDYVLCHMAFMLMDSIEKVIAEIHRVLKPKGIFSAVVGAKGPPAESKEVFIRLLDEALQAEGKTWSLRLGDPRIRKDDGVRELLSRASGFREPIQIEEHVLTQNLSAAQATEYFMLTYDPELLSPKGLYDFAIKLRSAFENMEDSGGLIACLSGLRQISCGRVP